MIIFLIYQKRKFHSLFIFLIAHFTQLKVFHSMQPQISSSICVRLTPKCRDSVELVEKQSSSDKKQIRLINRNSNDFFLYEFDEIYNKEFTNQTMYESMVFPRHYTSLLDIESALYCFIGSQGVGKTYTVTGQLSNIMECSGLLTYFMQDVFEYNNLISHHHEGKSSNSINNVVELRFLQILGDNIQNIGFETIYGESNNERELANRIDYKIDVKSFAHYENCISKIYERKKPHMHLVIEVTIKNEPILFTTKKTVLTFIEISSACYDEGNVHAQKIKSEVEALITIFQNIPRIKHLQHLFQITKFTKLLKSNFCQAKRVSFIGILDNSFKGNSTTLKWLKTALQLKEDKTIIQSMRQDIKRQEQYLKNLMQKHKKAMALLSKCIGQQLSFLQKQKGFCGKRQVQFGLGSSFNKRVQKIKIANLKKQQNEQQIQQLNRLIISQQQQIDQLEDKYKQDLKKLQEERSEIICVKNKLIAKMDENSQQILSKNMYTSTNSSLYWRPDINFQQGTPLNEKKNDLINQMKDTVTKKQLPSRSSSFKMSMKKIMNGNVSQNNLSTNKIQRKKLNYQHYQQQNNQNLWLEAKRGQNIIKQQTKRQVYELSLLIAQQQKQLNIVLKENNGRLPNRLVNKIKSRQQHTSMKGINEELFMKCLKEGKQFSLRSYEDFIINQDTFLNFSKDLLLKDRKTQQTIITNNGTSNRKG